ncbi:MAG: urate oxidase [Gemmatimonadota bacterium]
MARLGPNRYGKSAVRVVKVERSGDRHVLRDATVAIALEGQFEAAHLGGDNRAVLPTDTMKNTVYALARDGYTGSPEAFALHLARHFLEHPAPVTQVRIRIAEALWSRIEKHGKPHPSAFLRAGTEQRLARVDASHTGMTVHGGINDLLVLKTTDSAFEGFIRDQFTTLPDTSDRVLATAIRALWRYRTDPADYSGCWHTARSAILETFADHESRSVQHTLYAMGESVLAACDDVDEVRFVLPNRHHLPVDLSRLGLENRNDIFVATREPYGRIEAVVRRS